MRVKNPQLIGVLLLPLLAVGCNPVLLPEPSLESAGGLNDPASAERVESFSAERAWAHLKALTDIGARNVGSGGNARAREYIAGQLESMGLEVESWSTALVDSENESTESGALEGEITNLSARIPGSEFEDLFLLVAPFDSQYFADFEFVGANDGASGAAVVLEMARALVNRPLEFSTEIVFVDGEAPFSIGESPSDTSQRSEWAGRDALASRVQQWGTSSVRMMVFVNRVGDADLEISRDLMSHRVYREEFWEAAEDLGLIDVFPPDAAFEDAGVAHPIFNRIGFRRTVSIVDTRYGGDQPPGTYSGTEEDTIERCSAESLEAVGSVSLAALHSISRRLAKIDRFSRRPDSASGDAAVSEKVEEEPADTTGDTQMDPAVDAPVEQPAPSWESEPELATDTQDPKPSDEEEAAP